MGDLFVGTISGLQADLLSGVINTTCSNLEKCLIFCLRIAVSPTFSMKRHDHKKTVRPQRNNHGIRNEQISYIAVLRNCVHVQP